MTVYHTRVGIQQTLHPDEHPVQQPFEAPVNERDLEYYANPAWRGYLANKEQYERDFAPRGYLASFEEGNGNAEPRRIEVRYRLSDVDDLLSQVHKEREDRLRLARNDNALIGKPALISSYA